MTARSLRVKKSTLAVARKSISEASSKKSAPAKPSVLHGPRYYGLTKSGRQVVVARFYVTRHQGNRLYQWLRKQENWFVMDYRDGQIAEGTEEDGYRSKKDAVAAAEKVRDEAKVRYARSPF